MSDKEDTTAALGDSKVLSVQHSPSEPIPELSQRPEDGTKVPSASAGQDTGDVFPEDPPRAKLANQAHELKGKVSAFVGESAPESSDAEGLAGRSSDNEGNISNVRSHLLGADDLCEVAKVFDSWEAVLKHCGRESFNLRESSGLPAQWLPRHGGGLDATAHGQVAHHPSPYRPAASDSESMGAEAPEPLPHLSYLPSITMAADMGLSSQSKVTAQLRSFFPSSPGD